jgi:hypothetical protein
MATKALLGVNAEEELALDFLANMTTNIRKNWKK